MKNTKWVQFTKLSYKYIQNERSESTSYQVTSKPLLKQDKEIKKIPDCCSRETLHAQQQGFATIPECFLICTAGKPGNKVFNFFSVWIEYLKIYLTLKACHKAKF